MITNFSHFLGCMARIDKRILDAQVDVFIEWGRRTNTFAQDREWLEQFLAHTIKTDVLDLTQEDEEEFENWICGKLTAYQRHMAMKSIRALRRFYMARSKNGKSRLVGGRPPSIGNIERVQEYRKKGLAFRDIAKLLERPVSLVHRWSKYNLSRVK